MTTTTTTIGEHLLLERDGRTAILTINRADARNSMTFEMYDGIHDTCDVIERDPAIRVLVLRGAGDRAFASGTDIKQFLTFKTRDDALTYEGRITRVLRRISALTKPTIAMVQGDAVGGGLFMSLACDLRVAADHARFGAPVARTLGNSLAPFSFTLIASTIGLTRAREMLLTTRLLDAAEAKAVGLVDRVHPGAELETAVRTLAGQMATYAPLTLAAVKEATRRVRENFVIPDAEEIVLSCYLSEDFQEGVRAFLEKRPPRWEGR
jgi:enoyl-CoA hydratase/carnithine racemase